MGGWAVGGEQAAGGYVKVLRVEVKVLVGVVKALWDVVKARSNRLNEIIVYVMQ